MKKVLFIDRDGTLNTEPTDEQVDAFEKVEFLPKVFRNMYYIQKNLDYELVMVTNQDGLGTDSFPEDTFWPVQNFIVKAFENEGIVFDEICIDRSFPRDNLPTRKPGTAMLTKYMEGEYDLANSFVLGDRLTDIQLAKNLGAKGIFINDGSLVDEMEKQELANTCALVSEDWDDIYACVASPERTAEVVRTTKETDIQIQLNLDGSGVCNISTGLNFFDHMLNQIGPASKSVVT